MNIQQQVRTAAQQQIVEQLTAKFDIDGDRVLFLNPKNPAEPWLPPAELMTIARKIGGFQAIDTDISQYIEPLQQISYKATVIDKDGVSYSRPGTAKIGEMTPVGEIDANVLAEGRALSAALRAAGFDPTKSGSVTQISDYKQTQQLSDDEKLKRETEDRLALEQRDRKQIHALAAEKGLIKTLADGTKDLTPYRRFLWQKFGKTSTVGMSPAERSITINELRNYLSDEEFEEQMETDLAA